MAILSIEATVISIFNIVFFSAFLGARLSGVLNLAEAITPIIVKFSVENSSRGYCRVLCLQILFLTSERRVHVYGHAGDTAVWLYHFRNTEGSGALTVLTIGIILGNDREILRMLGKNPPPANAFSELKSI
ncbi:MAG: hypothetical protein QXH90_07490 [Candidatus Korarchaeum sp.]